MQRYTLSFVLTLSLILVVLGAPLRHQRSAAQARVLPKSATTPGSQAAALGGALNPDGTLKATAGSFDATGYRMELAANGAPRFVPARASAPATANCWDTTFTLPDGTGGTVRAVAVLGTDVYVGGEFQAVGNLAANFVARYSPATNTWSTLGSGGGNGVNNQVWALAVSGSDLYVGGFFTGANVGGSPVAANRVAKYNTSTNTWSALGAGGGVGVNSSVFALALSGSDLYVGGVFTGANVGGTTVAANRVAKYNLSTNTWSVLGASSSNGLNFTINALALSGSDLFVGGFFGAAGGNVSANFARYLGNVTPTTPTITAASGLLRPKGSSASNAPIATVNDAEDAADSLTVTVNGAATATVNGVTVANLVVNAAGQVTADIDTSCAATTATFELRVTDCCGHATITPLTVTVPPNPTPTLSYSDRSLLSGAATTINPATGPSDNGTIASVVVQSVGTYTGTISVNAAGVVSLSNASPVGAHTITVRALDDCGATTDASFTLTVVNCPTITVNPATLPAGRAGTLYSQSLTQTGGSGTITWSVSSGALPTGLSFNSGSGLLDGTPTVSGSFNFTVRATDVNGCTGERAYTLLLNPPCTTITLSPATLANGFIGTAYNQALTATGETGPHSFAVTSGSLPDGLTLASGGALTGTPTALGTFDFTVTATDNTGCTGTRAGATACTQPNAPIAGQTSLTQPGRDLCGIPATAVALTGHLTTVNSGGGFLTLYPSNAVQPTVASVNYAPNEIINNVFTVGLGTDGAFKIFAFNTTDVVVDVTGYYAPPVTNGLFFHPLPKPIRLLETRAGQLGCNTPGVAIQGGEAGTLTQQARLTCDGVTIPNGALAIVGNATTVSPQGPGFLTLFPGNALRPLAASSNYNAGQIVNGPFSVGLAPNGEFKIYSAATTDLVVDVLGYYSPEVNDVNGAGLLFSALPKPVRLLETRAGQPVGCNLPGAPLTGQQEYTQAARGTCDDLTIPANALGLVGNATVVQPLGPGFLTLWPSTAARPLVATANYNAGDVGNRHFIVGLGAGDGAFKMFSFAMSNLVLDLSGYFAP